MQLEYLVCITVLAIFSKSMILMETLWRTNIPKTF